VILVDDKYVADYDQNLANVKSVTNQPIKYILSTHYHADHSGGNTRFASTVEIISTVNAP
jgi:glyoxylase-like metal-dependent hydrolase (beta-lactamase superfamily II)